MKVCLLLFIFFCTYVSSWAKPSPVKIHLVEGGELGRLLLAGLKVHSRLEEFVRRPVKEVYTVVSVGKVKSSKNGDSVLVGLRREGTSVTKQVTLRGAHGLERLSKQLLEGGDQYDIFVSRKDSGWLEGKLWTRAGVLQYSSREGLSAPHRLDHFVADYLSSRRFSGKLSPFSSTNTDLYCWSNEGAPNKPPYKVESLYFVADGAPDQMARIAVRLSNPSQLWDISKRVSLPLGFIDISVFSQITGRLDLVGLSSPKVLEGFFNRVLAEKMGMSGCQFLSSPGYIQVGRLRRGHKLEEWYFESRYRLSMIPEAEVLSDFSFIRELGPRDIRLHSRLSCMAFYQFQGEENYKVRFPRWTRDDFFLNSSLPKNYFGHYSGPYNYLDFFIWKNREVGKSESDFNFLNISQRWDVYSDYEDEVGLSVSTWDDPRLQRNYQLYIDPGVSSEKDEKSELYIEFSLRSEEGRGEDRKVYFKNRVPLDLELEDQFYFQFSVDNEELDNVSIECRKESPEEIKLIRYPLKK